MEVPVSAEGSSVTVEVIPKEKTTREYIQSKVVASGREDTEDPFYVVDLGRLLDLHSGWLKALPTIQPFYAVKCNEDPALLSTLAALGLGFDCASKNEIKAVLDLGVPPERIIYANPCKQNSHIKYAARKDVRLMTFDNEMELYKVKTHFPTARLVLRIRADDPNALCQLGLKFGCDIPTSYHLLQTAKDLNLEVVGVSFHVGSGCQTPSAYLSALELAADVFRYGTTLGHHFTLLDIGGGFPGTKDSGELFHQVATAIKEGLKCHFDSHPGLRVIAEPGRYFASSTHTLAVSVISKRREEGEKGPSYMYYVNDGVYGSFNCILFDHVTPTPTVLEEYPPSTCVYSTSLWGPTCDGLDRICDCVMPELQLGDWIYFHDMGAYTVSAASTFNGFLRPRTYYCVTAANCERLKQVHSVQSVSRPVEEEGKRVIVAESRQRASTLPLPEELIQTVASLASPQLDQQMHVQLEVY